MLYNYHHYLIPEISSIQKRNPHPLAVPFSPPSSPRQPFIYFTSLWICLFWTFHINGIINMWSFVIGFFHSCCSTYWYLTPFYGGIVFHCMYSILFIHSSIGHLGGLHLSVIMNKDAMNISTHIYFCEDTCHISLRYISSSGIDGSCDNCV